MLCVWFRSYKTQIHQPKNDVNIIDMLFWCMILDYTGESINLAPSRFNPGTTEFLLNMNDLLRYSKSPDLVQFAIYLTLCIISINK